MGFQEDFQSPSGHLVSVQFCRYLLLIVFWKSLILDEAEVPAAVAAQEDLLFGMLMGKSKALK